jgi:hypothetical protein
MEKSSGPKFNPIIVTLPAAVVTVFGRVRSVIAGASYVKKSGPVPITLSTATERRAAPDPEIELHIKALTVTQEVVSHGLPPKFRSGLRLLMPKSKPVMVTLRSALVGALKFWAPRTEWVVNVTTGESKVNESASCPARP